MMLVAKGCEALGIACVMIGLVQGIQSSSMWMELYLSIIGMTTSPEAFLAAEAEIAYAVMAHVTDYDVWHDNEEPVSVEQVLRVIQGNTQLAQRAISQLTQTMAEWADEFPAHTAMKDALLTEKTRIPDVLKLALKPLIGKYVD